jgi:hypothetical protein
MSSSLGRVYSFINNYLNEVTDRALRNPKIEYMPVVGLSSSLLNLIYVQKGMFIFEAHTGGGKTTFGRLLYHYARRGIIPYDVIYLDLSSMKRVENVDPGLLMRKIEEIMARPAEYSTKDYVMSSTARNYIEGGNIKFEYILENVKDVPLIVVLDELEKAVEISAPAIPNQLAGWAEAIRVYYNKTGTIPVKVIILSVMTASTREALRHKIAERGRDVEVFTEFRSLEIDYDTLTDYLNKLNEHFRLMGLDASLIGDVIDPRSLRELIDVLINLRNGRYIFPYLRRAIALSVERYLEGYQFPPNIDLASIINALNEVSSRGKAAEKINVKELVSRPVIALTRDHYYGIEDTRREAIRVWTISIGNLCRILAKMLAGRLAVREAEERVSEISHEPNYIIQYVARDTFIWFSLARKAISKSSFEKAISKIYKRVLEQEVEREVARRPRGVTRSIQVLLLKPSGVPVDFITTMIRGSVEFRFKVHNLTKDELLSLLGVTARYDIDLDTSRTIVDELVAQLGALLMSGG